MGVLRYYNDFKADYRTAGGRKAFQNLICELIGVKDQIETLQFFLNQLHEPSSLGVSKDEDLRIMQKCDVVLLAIFHKFCENNGLTYWMDYGTLLGAVRHDGFIPWDDDLDLAMPRNDFDILYSLLEKDLIPKGLEICKLDYGKIIGISYNHLQTGIWLDVFPVDSLSSQNTLDDCNTKESIVKSINRYRNYWNNNKKNKDYNFFREKRREMIDEIIEGGDNIILYHAPEFQEENNRIYDYTTIYPLSLRKFEDYSFFAPNDLNGYLKGEFGDKYMNFPKDGVLHHGYGRGPLSSWAKKNGVDMNEVYKRLMDILNNL